MTRVAIYARKSTEQTSRADEDKSVDRQVANARAFAAANGWTVDDAHIYVDDAISGAETTRLRAKQRLLDTIHSGRAPFSVLVMQSNDRLSRRDGDEAFAELKAIARAGVAVWFYSDRTRFEFGTFAANTIGFIRAEVAAEFRRIGAAKTTEAMRRKAELGHVTGGRVFGYDNVRYASHTERRVNELQASVVRRIFQLSADGLGQKRIAQRLNAEGALAPRAQHGRPHAWASSSVHAVLFRELYRGQQIWNRTKKRDDSGQKRPTDRPASEWLRLEAPHLRIVSDELWAAAHARIAASRVTHRVGTPEARGGRPKTLEPKYLLTGFARCSCCNGGLHVRSTHHGSPGQRTRVRFYACTTHYNRGADVCGNALRVRMETVDGAVMDAIAEILTPDLADDVVARVRELLHPHQVDPRTLLEDELRALERHIGHLTDAIEMGGSLPTLVTRLQQAEERRHALATARAAPPGPLPLARVDWRLLEREARQKLADWRRLLTRQVTQGRQLLALVLEAPIVFTPFDEGHARGYRFRGEAAIGGLLGGVVDVLQSLCARGSTAFGDSSPPGRAGCGKRSYCGLRLRASPFRGIGHCSTGCGASVLYFRSNECDQDDTGES